MLLGLKDPLVPLERRENRANKECPENQEDQGPLDSVVYQDQRESEEIVDSRAFQVRPEHQAGRGLKGTQELQAKLDHKDLLVKLE